MLSSARPGPGPGETAQTIVVANGADHGIVISLGTNIHFRDKYFGVDGRQSTSKYPSSLSEATRLIYPSALSGVKAAFLVVSIDTYMVVKCSSHILSKSYCTSSHYPVLMRTQFELGSHKRVSSMLDIPLGVGPRS